MYINKKVKELNSTDEIIDLIGDLEKETSFEKKEVFAKVLNNLKQETKKSDLIEPDITIFDDHKANLERDVTSTEPSLINDSLVVESSALLQKYKFRAVVNVYVTKNNVSWLLTDVTRSNIFFKITGGQICKRGTDKNTSKTTLKNFETVIKTCKELNVNHLTFYVNTGFSTKKHIGLTKNLVKLLMLFKDESIEKYEEIYACRKPPVSTVRVKGGRRGRRV